MTLEKLKAEVAEHRAGLKSKTGTVCMFSESGPVGMSLIDAIVKVLEDQERRIKELDANSRIGP